ncbi:MAG: peptidoglycan-binding protein [Fibrobacterota bacterium]|nr:MAG: peptidoglycan-binding protein [Fibrobacterota bacterium]
MSNSQSDPSRPTDPELMRISKARPPSGDLDLSKFAPRKAGAAPKKGAHYDTSKYMEQLREEDPWPDEDAFQNSAEIKVTLVTCEITTPVADIAFDKPVHVKAEVQVIKAPDDQSVRLRLQRAASAAGPWTDLTEVVSRTITTTVSPPNQTVETDLLLATPNPVPAFGADVFYRAVATNNQAAVKESPVVVVKYRRLTEMIGAPEITHPEHSLIPRLGEDGMLVRALAAYLGKVALLPPATADKAVVFGFSYLEKDLKANRKLSSQRAEVLKSLLDRDFTLWEKHRGDFTTRDKQQILSDLNIGFGWDCAPGKVDGLSGPKTSSGVRGFQKEYNKRYVKVDDKGKPLPGEVKLTEDGICGKKTWNGIHRALCALVAKQLNPAFADPAPPAWQVPDWHYAPGQGAYPNGMDFPPPDRGGELNLFHPSDAPALVVPTDTTALTVAENPVEDPTKYQKRKIPVAPLGGVVPVDPDRAAPTIETYDPAEPVTESGTNAKRIERSGQAVEIRQWVNLTTKDGGRDGKGTKVKLRIRSKDALRDEPNAKKLPDQIFLKVVFSADGGPANRLPRSDADNKFGLVTTPNLTAVTAPTAASLQRAATGGWQTTPAAPWEYSATINTAAAKMVEIEIDVGLCGGDTCEVQVGATNACDAARVRFVNWRRLEYELMVAECQKTNMDATNATRWDFKQTLKNFVTQRLGAGFVAYESRATHVYTKAQADAKQWVTAAFLKQSGPEDRIVRAWKWPSPSGVAFLPEDKRTIRMVTGDVLVNRKIRQFTSLWMRAVAAISNVPNHTLITSPNQKHIRLSLPQFPTESSKSIDVGSYDWEADIDKSTVPLLNPILTITDAPDPSLGQDAYELDALNPDGTTSSNTRKVNFDPGDDSLGWWARRSCNTSVEDALDDELIYRCSLRAKIRIRHHPSAPGLAARLAAIRSHLNAEFQNEREPIRFHPGLDSDGDPRTGSLEAAWFSHPDIESIRLSLPKRANVNIDWLPGDFAGNRDALHCPVKWRIKIKTTNELNGCALDGTQEMSMRRPDGPLSSTICHELGHDMALAPFRNGAQNQVGLAPGMKEAGHVDQTPRTMPYLDCEVFNLGPGNGLRDIHRGPHCATGIPVADLPDSKFNGKKGSCIMFGEGGNSDTRPSYCPTCNQALRSRTLNDLRTSWASRY